MIEVHDDRSIQPKSLHYEKQFIGFRMRSTLPRRVEV